MLLPECTSAPSHLDEVLNGFSSFYLIRDLPVYELLDTSFLQAAVFQGKNCTHTPQYRGSVLMQKHLAHLCVCVSGSVYGLSYRTRIDEDNCVALMPNGETSADPGGAERSADLQSVLCRTPASVPGQRRLRAAGGGGQTVQVQPQDQQQIWWER